jgi:threonine dehydrogenase-like Zn-dependent dehydrogenase
MTTMRAAAIMEPGRIETRALEIPEPNAGQVRVRLEGSGVCASNLEIWAGQPWFTYPLQPGAPGHEGWGSIDAVGADVEGFRPGDRVTFLSGNAYSEYDIAEAAQLVVLPPQLEGRQFPGEPLGCAINIMNRSRIEGGSTVAIVGIGFLGAVLTRLARDAGARVLSLSRREFALDVARSMGADAAVPMDDHSRVIDRVRELTGGDLCDTVIEATGKAWPLDVAAEITRERGTLVIAGYHQDGPRQIDMQLWNWRGLDVVNAHERDPRIYVEGIRTAVRMVASGRFDPTPLFTHTFPLDQLGAALDATRDRPDGFLKAVVTL